MDPVEEIKQLYYRTTKASIDRDLARAIELLKTLPSEADRERAAVYMDGLAQMRSEWKLSAPTDRAASSRSAPRSRRR